MKMVQSFSVVLVAIVLLSCGASTLTADTSPEILYGEDICNQCGMIISDERFAAGLVVELTPGEYEHRVFDDIGGMLAYQMENGDLEIVKYYVHDYNSREWLDAKNAFFVWSEAIHTPMGFGLAACAQRAEAEALAQEWNGALFTFSDLQKELIDLTAASEAHEH